METENADGRIQGQILKFDMGRNSGIIRDVEGKTYPFEAKDLSGNYTNINLRPAVRFNIKNGKAVEIVQGGVLPPAKYRPVSGLAIRGAQKCLSCNWRLPFLLEKEIKHVRSGKTIACPACKQNMRLKSWFNNIHLPLSAGYLFLGTVGGRLVPFWDIRLLVIILCIFGFFFVYGQRKFVPIRVDEVFE